MDRVIYVAMTGAKYLLSRQGNVAQNLANVSTTGYRAVENAFRAVPVVGEGLPTRAFVVDSTTGSNFAAGPVQTTGRDLDVAVQGAGWIAVQGGDGKEAYTRSGSALCIGVRFQWQAMKPSRALAYSGQKVPPNLKEWRPRIQVSEPAN